MARMIPATIDPRCPSPGERDLFALFRDEDGTADWTVLHSLDIAQHRRAAGGEADFVVMIPGKGVLVLEVKACRSLVRNDLGWFYGSDAKADRRGPFRQASEAMHSLRSRISSVSGLNRVLFWSAVVFPYIDFHEQSPEWHPWQVIDRTALRGRKLSSLIPSVLDTARGWMAEHRTGAAWFDPDLPIARNLLGRP